MPYKIKPYELDKSIRLGRSKLDKPFVTINSLALASVLCVIIFHQISIIAAYIGSVFFILMVVSIIGWLLTYDWSIYNKDDTNQWGD